MRFTAFLVLLVGLPVSAACLAEPDEPALAACLSQRLSEAPSGVGWLPEPSELQDSELRVLAAVQSLLEASSTPLDIVQRSSLWELRGNAFSSVARHADADEAWDRALALDDGLPRIEWRNPDLSLAWTGTLGGSSPRADRIAARRLRKPMAPDAQPIRSTTWLQPLPDVAVEVIRGEPISLRHSAAKAILLDFWATWCEPCRKELPHLEALWERYRDQGLQVVAVNVYEELPVVLPYVDEVGLTAPVGRMSEALESLELDALPALFLADGEGRVRRRWNGFKEGLEVEIADALSELLADTITEPETLGLLQAGVGPVRVQWTRTARQPFQSLAFLHEAGTHALEVIAALNGAMIVFDVNGAVTRQRKIPPYAGTMRTVERSAAGQPLLVGFRSAASRLVYLDWADKAREQWDAGVPIFDVRFVDPDAESSDVVLATLAGVQSWTPGADKLTLRNPEVLASSLIRLGGDHWIALVPGEGVASLDENFQVQARQPTIAAGWTLVSGGVGGGFGILPESVIAQAHGRVFGETEEVAVLNDDGHLRVFETTSGRLVHHSLWEDPGEVAIVDLDGDGRDELFVTAGNRLVVLEAAP